MGISVEHRRLQPHDFQQVLDLFLCLSITGCLTVKQHWLGDRIADLDFWVQAGVGILKDHLYFAAQATLFAGRYFEVRNVLSLIKHLPRGGGRQRKDRSGQRGLTGTGFSHDSQHLAGIDFETDILCGVHVSLFFNQLSLFHREHLSQMFCFQNGGFLFFTHGTVPPLQSSSSIERYGLLPPALPVEFWCGTPPCSVGSDPQTDTPP